MSRDYSEETLDLLLRTPIGLEQLLQCSPFDPEKNFKTKLSEEWFFEHLFFGDNEVFEGYDSRITDVIWSGPRILSLEGHSGVGKTTFLKSFIKRHADSFNFNYIDCYKYASKGLRSALNETDIKNLDRSIQTAASEAIKASLLITRDKIAKDIVRSEKNNSITRILRMYIKSFSLSEMERRSFVFFLTRNRSVMSDCFTGDTIHAQLENLSKRSDGSQGEADAWDDILEEIQTHDSFLLLYTLIEFLRNTRGQLEKPEVIIFDNLDAISMDLLHKDFLQLFYDSQHAFGLLCEGVNLRNPELTFSADQNFIFALRDANNSSITEHVSGSFDIERVSFRCPAIFYRDIISKRLEYYLNKVELPVGRYARAREIVALLNFLADQPFYTNVMVPAFNMDYRRLSKALYGLMESFIPDRPRPGLRDWSGAFNIKFPKLVPEPLSPFSLKSGIPRVPLVFKAEVPREELEGFFGAILYGVIGRLHSDDFYFTQGVDPVEGYCLASRMLLTFILNNSGHKESREFISHNNRYEEVKLSYILRRTRGIYEEPEVLRTLVNLFRVNDKKDQMTYLASFRQTEIYSNNAFDDLDKMLEDHNKWHYLQDYASLVISQAGFIFLRDLIVHYEFYARLAEIEKPLFLFRGDVIDRDAGPEYDFETSIRRTFKLVETHSNSMQKFYAAKFRRDGVQKYLSSHFVFKHSGGIAKREGLFHITRIVVAHIEYIDEYRRWLLRRLDSNMTSKKAINESLLTFITDYLSLFSQWQDKDSKMEVYAKAALENIRTISESRDNWPLQVAPTDSQLVTPRKIID